VLTRAHWPAATSTPRRATCAARRRRRS
jgi:hypothetical protein